MIIRRIRAYRDIDGWLTDNEAAALYILSRLMHTNRTIVEIGSWKGKSTYCLAKDLGSNCHIHAIDPFDASGEPGSNELYKERMGQTLLVDQFIGNMRRFSVLEKIILKKGYSHQFVGQFRAIDLLFIDGDHSIRGCDSDFLNYSPLVSSGGYIALHDFDPSRKELGSTWVVTNRVMPSKKYLFWGIFDSLWIAKKV